MLGVTAELVSGVLSFLVDVHPRRSRDVDTETRLKEKVMDMRKEHSEKPWPPHDRDVGVILVAHSMG